MDLIMLPLVWSSSPIRILYHTGTDALLGVGRMDLCGSLPLPPGYRVDVPVIVVGGGLLGLRFFGVHMDVKNLLTAA